VSPLFLQPFSFVLKVAKIGLSILGTPAKAPAPRNTQPASAMPAASASVKSEGQGERVVASASAQALATALVKAYDATVAALDPRVVDLDACEQRDKEAAEYAEALQALYSSTSSDVPEAVRNEYGTLVERVAQAQLQIMAFAINRKNRGEPDSAQTEAEQRDRDEFKREVAPTYGAVLKALRG